jgi:hypothetical protein
VVVEPADAAAPAVKERKGAKRAAPARAEEAAATAPASQPKQARARK